MKKLILSIMLFLILISLISCKETATQTPSNTQVSETTPQTLNTDTAGIALESEISLTTDGKRATVSFRFPLEGGKEAAVVIVKKGGDHKDEGSLLAITQVTLDNDGKGSAVLVLDYDGEFTVWATSEGGKQLTKEGKTQ